MSAPLQRAQDTFGPQCSKTFEAALHSFLVNAIASLVTAHHYPNSTHKAQGQIRWSAVHKD